MNKFIKEIDKSWTLFLDRDGVINKRIFGGYVKSWDEFEFLPGVLEAISIFSIIFNRIVIVTNQQGIGKGLMNESQLNTIHKKIIESVSNSGGRIDSIYYCPDLANKENNCRKPGINMASMAKEDFPDINLIKSIIVGDSVSDIMFGKNAGMKTILHESEENIIVDADLKVKSLLEFAHLIKSMNKI